jgi:hypothetical protein
MNRTDWPLIACVVALGGGIACKPKSQPESRQPEARVQEVVELSLEERAEFQQRREAETKTVKALYDIICAADPAAKSNFEIYLGRDETLVALDGLLHSGKLKDSEMTINIRMARDKKGGGDVFKFIHRGGEDPYKGFALAGSVIWLLSGRELNREFKKYNWIDFVKDGGKDFQSRVTPAITEHVEELWGREFDIKKDCLMEVLVPPGVVDECKAGAKRWLNGDRPLPRVR